MKRKVIKIDEELCTGCGKCVLACAEGAIEIRQGKAQVISESYCDGLGACIGECPEGALTIEEREAPEFDEEAVKRHLKTKGAELAACPSSAMRLMPEGGPAGPSRGGPSQLRNWPIQIRLAHPDAPYFKDARLLIAADCSAFAYGAMHPDFIKDRVVLIGCSKLDEIEPTINKLAEIFRRNHIKDITLLHMEVPCCSGMRVLVKRALEQAQKKVPLDVVVISRDGRVLAEEAQ